MKARNQHSGRIEVKKGKDYLNEIRAAWQGVYKKACEYDKIPIDSEFAVFSADNPFLRFVDQAAKDYFRAKNEYQNGGYVGLTMS